ncbi:MAG: hypothetical protein ACRDGU_07265 [Actinomycetota bacterium]
MKGRLARKRATAGNLRRSSPRTKPEEAVAASVDDASLRPLARALLALAEELLKREGKKG